MWTLPNFLFMMMYYFLIPQVNDTKHTNINKISFYYHFMRGIHAPDYNWDLNHFNILCQTRLFYFPQKVTPDLGCVNPRLDPTLMDLVQSYRDPQDLIH